jgi:hypothetical protein
MVPLFQQWWAPAAGCGRASKRRRELDPLDRRLSQRWRWRVDERCVVPVRVFVTGFGQWTERDEMRNGLGVVLAKLLDVMQLEGLLLLVQGCGLE